MTTVSRFRWRGNQMLRSFSHSSAVLFFLGSAIVASFVGIVFFWLAISSFQRPEGSWSVGIYYGKNPFSLVPIELADKQNGNSSAWPVANPVLTCASATDAGFPSNFVADPFLFIEGDTLYLFFETKSIATMQGDIGVARSTNQGEWHLSYPFVFKYNDQVYMMPEGARMGPPPVSSHQVPLQWTLEKVLIKRPLVDTSMVKYDTHYWLFTSDFKRFGVEKNAELEIWYTQKEPHLQVWQELGCRNGGRPFMYSGHLHRLGQDCSGTYGRDLRVYRVEKLTKDDYEEVPVTLNVEKPMKGRNSWNGIRRHHLDAQELPSGGWIAVMDGDRVLLAIQHGAVGFLAGAVSCGNFGRRNDCLCSFWSRPQFTMKLRRTFAGVNRYGAAVRWRLNLQHVLASWSSSSSPLRHYSQFTMVTMTYEGDCRHLEQGQAPSPDDFDSAVPVRVRAEEHNSLNNRFRVDPAIKTRAVLELDDDIMMTCGDIERGFKAWRQHPERLVGFYPRLLEGKPPKNGYNAILTGAAFMDSEAAFRRYWSEAAAEGRKIVEESFNCEDVLMNFLYANASGSARTVEYIHPAWAIDTSKFSASAISRNTQAHYDIRTSCLSKFSAIYGSLPPLLEFGLREDRWDT
ncbi:unnamed protein product [Spirodela intermedia]|uniref:Uncharacterized protein n=1 Tax=Spirodela intermedia TaxID=51605 RepID=A0A7I8JRP5_SPIIN|nr:unnamed protein product [Spirodela intermedia]CAA6672799.1 unnamed protein product [Spirodela intermedia]